MPPTHEARAFRALPSKSALRSELVELVRADLQAAEQSQRITMQAATHEEARPENDKDTRALEQSYLARGQAQRVEQLRAELTELLALELRELPGDAPVVLGAVVVVDEDGVEQTLFLAPARGGTELRGGVRVVTPSSPLGRALVGKSAGESCELRLPQKLRELSIRQVG